MPGSITPRHGHSAVVFESGSRLRVVVLFGGKQPSRLLGKGKKYTICPLYIGFCAANFLLS